MTSNKSRQYSNLLKMMSLINISASLLSIYIFIKSIYLELIKSLIRVIHNSLVTHGVGEGVLAAIRARWEAKLYGAAPSQGATTTCPTRTSPSRMTSTAPSLATALFQRAPLRGHRQGGAPPCHRRSVRCCRRCRERTSTARLGRWPLRIFSGDFLGNARGMMTTCRALS